MNSNEPITFQKERDFGEVFTHTFQFVKQDYRKLGDIFLKYCGPLIILTIIASSMYQYKTIGITFDPYSDDIRAFLGEFLGLFIIMMVLSLATYTMVLATIYGYITLYIEKGSEGFRAEDVWNKITENYLKILAANLLVGIVVCIGILFCILPGIYLSISLVMVPIALVFEKSDVFAAFSRSFEITHARWWWTFLLIIVFSMMIVIASLLFSIPSIIITAINGYGMVEITESTKIVITVFNILSSLISYVLNVFLIIAIAFQYFAIAESKARRINF